MSAQKIRLFVFLGGILAGVIAGIFYFTKPGEGPVAADDQPVVPTQIEAEASSDNPVQTEPEANSAKNSPNLADGPLIVDITSNAAAYPNGHVPRYEKFEITFQVEDTVARNLQWPYDANPPHGVEPAIGLSVDAHLTPDNWQTVYSQPAFYYQAFQQDIKGGQDWLYPTEEFSWKVRFSPNVEGDWQFKLTAQDASSSFETEAISFTVGPSQNKGFIKVSEADRRYFEFDDGTYFPALGYNLAVVANQDSFQIMSQNGIQLVRTWLPSQWSIFGAAWSPWRSFGAAPLSQEPNARLRYDSSPPFNLTPGVDPSLARPESEVFLWLSHDETVFDDGNQWNFVPCVVVGWNSPQLPVKRNTGYRLRVRYKEQDLVGPRVAGRPYGLTAKIAGWLWHENDETQRCYYPGTGTLLAATYSSGESWSYYPDADNPGWQILEGRFNSGDIDFIDKFYLALENVISGHAFIDYVWLEEILGNDQYGPNVVYKPWMAHHQYFDQRNSYAFDQTVELAQAYDIYLKLVILEKNDYALNIFEPDGSFSTDLPHQNSGMLFFGAGRETNGKTKVRWLQEAWWRYLQARWGYSPHIHSWELLNEGDPASELHHILVDEMGRYFQESFIPAGQQTRHPNTHLVTTSFWSHFPQAFWQSADYPYVDYADVHYYPNEAGIYSLDYIYDPGDFYDAALVSEKLSMYHGAKQPNGPGKPVMRGEIGFIFDQTDLFSQDVTSGVWLHNFVWAGINSGGLIESYWVGAPTQDQIYKAGSHDYRPMFKTFYNFISDLPLNNGHYQDAAAAASNPALRVWGQKDLVNGRAHVWIQNKSHTWKNVADGVSVAAVSGTISLSGFQADEIYTIQWWDPYQPDLLQQVIGTETVVAQADGSIAVTVDNLTTDIAVKILRP